MKWLFLLFITVTIAAAGCAGEARGRNFSPAAPTRGTPVVLPGEWLVAQLGGGKSSYWLIPASEQAYLDLQQGEPLSFPCQVNHDVWLGAKQTAIIHCAPCPTPSPSGECWYLASLANKGQQGQEVPSLRSPLFLYQEKVLYPCGTSSSFTRWCEWDLSRREQSNYFQIQLPAQVDEQNSMPFAWEPPWLLMGEELSCAVSGGKVLGGVKRYWLENLYTGLSAPWPVWEAVHASPRCLALGEPVEGYTRIEIIGWNPNKYGELAFAVQRFQGESYQKALYEYPFQTEIYIWNMSTTNAFQSIGTFSGLQCGIWAPDGSGVLCYTAPEQGKGGKYLFISRSGKILANWLKEADKEIIQWRAFGN